VRSGSLVEPISIQTGITSLISYQPHQMAFFRTTNKPPHVLSRCFVECVLACFVEAVVEFGIDNRLSLLSSITKALRRYEIRSYQDAPYVML
jgi:hypothetical protein